MTSPPPNQDVFSTGENLAKHQQVFMAEGSSSLQAQLYPPTEPLTQIPMAPPLGKASRCSSPLCSAVYVFSFCLAVDNLPVAGLSGTTFRTKQSPPPPTSGL